MKNNGGERREEMGNMLIKCGRREIEVSFVGKG